MSAFFAFDVARYASGRAYHNFSLGGKIACQFAIKPKIGLRNNISFYYCAFYNPVGFTQQVGIRLLRFIKHPLFYR
jgi:hypothetical protein